MKPIAAHAETFVAHLMRGTLVEIGNPRRAIVPLPERVDAKMETGKYRHATRAEVWHLALEIAQEAAGSV